MTDWLNKDAADKALSATLSRTVDFLKFAETKNAALLTFASAWLLALASLVANDRITDKGSLIATAAAGLLFALAAITALCSFLPRMRLADFFLSPNRSGNLLYFADIAETDPNTFVERFRERYNSTSEGISDAFLTDLAVQVAVNSSITRRKFRAFNVGAAFVLAAMMVLTCRCAFITYSHFWLK